MAQLPIRSLTLLRQLLSLREEEGRAAARQGALEAEERRIGALQEQLCKNLGALGGSKREVDIRNRLLDDLEASEERRRAVALARAELEQQAQARTTSRHELLAAISRPVSTTDALPRTSLIMPASPSTRRLIARDGTR